jgi:hypothetical protein
MNKILATTVFVLALALSGFAQATCTRHTEIAGGYSFCPPAGWAVEESPGQKFKIVMGPVGNVFTPNINVQSSDSTIALSAYADAAVKAILESVGDKVVGASNIDLVSRTAFTTDSKLTGIKVVFRTNFQGIVIYSAQYMFDTGKGKLLVTGTSLESEKEANGKLFDAALKTFKIGG